MSQPTLRTGNKKAMLQSQGQSGFTLIELLLVIALMVFSIGITGDIIITLTRSYSKSQVQTEIEQNSNFVSLKLEKELRNAQYVVTSQTTSTRIAFVDNTGQSTVCYSVSGGVLGRASVGVSVSCPAAFSSYTPLTSADINGGVSISCGSATNCFSVTQASGGPYVVRIHFEFAQANSTARNDLTGSTSYDNVIVVRGSY